MKGVCPAVLLATAFVAGCGGGSRPVQSGVGVLHTVRDSQAAEIRAARSSNPGLFGIFPTHPGKSACAIPDGGMSAVKLKGTCLTSVTYPVTHGRYPVADVRFRESWGHAHSSSWVVLVEWPAEKVVGTQLHGETSPQMRYAISDKTPGDQPALDAAAGYAEKVAGDAHVFTGVVVDDPNDEVIVYLHHAPQSILARLRATHPGTYVIHNDAPRTLHAVMQLQQAMHWNAWKAQGIDIVESGPTQTGYLQVGVKSSVKKAQAAFDAKFGRGTIRVVHAEPAVAL